jgi:heptosyltransferase-1
MTEILFIKTSSMGDVLHHMPAVTDARKRFPGARMTWVVDEMYVPLARLHPAIDEIIPIAVRRWRKQLYKASAWKEFYKAVRQIRARSFDKIIDTQGLVRTALTAKLAYGERHGYDAESIREPFAAKFYDVNHKVGWDLHVIARNRTLTARALGYSPDGAPDYGFNRSKIKASASGNYAIIFHATAKAKKEWPEERWIEIARSLSKRGFEVVLPWGNETERARSERIAVATPNARVPARVPIIDVAHLIAGAKLVCGVDTGFLHIAAALGVPVAAVFTITKSHTAIPMGPGRVEMVGADNGLPEVRDVLAAVEKLAPS